MPYNQQQERREKPTKKDLSPQDIEIIYSDLPAYQGVEPAARWPEKDLRLIWNRCIPTDAALGDFIFFLYACQRRGLDPLLSEAYLRMQWDRDSGTVKPIVMSGIGGMLKLAQLSHEFDGLKVEFQEGNQGELVSATCRIWKKGSTQSFETTVFFSEYASYNKEGQPTYMWKNKPHVMVSKCAQAACLRVAFAAELAGVYIEEEFQRQEPPANFVVQSTDDQPKTTSEHQTLKAVEPTPPSAPPPSEPATLTVTGPPSPEPSLKQRLIAIKQRLMTDLSIPTRDRKSILNKYFIGFLDVHNEESLPKDPEPYLRPLNMLDHLATYGRVTGPVLLNDAEAIGRGAKMLYDLWYRNEWEFSTSALGHRVALLFDYAEFSELQKYLQANGIALVQEADVRAFLRLALIDRELAKDAGIRAEAVGIPVEMLLADLQERLGGPVENFTLANIRQAFNEKGAATNA